MSWDTSGNSPQIQYQYGGFFKRALGFLIDLFLIMISNMMLIGLGLLAACKAMNDLNLSSPSEDLVFLLTGLFILSSLGLFLSYLIYFNSMGQTPGKKLLGLKVISRSGESVRPVQAVARALGLLLTLFFFFPGFLFILFNKQKLSFHDLLASTYVIRT
jgi:uncharacterized RDD family membrane protein YckC